MLPDAAFAIISDALYQPSSPSRALLRLTEEWRRHSVLLRHMSHMTDGLSKSQNIYMPPQREKD